jgi:signal transduction histidine kinase
MVERIRQDGGLRPLTAAAMVGFVLVVYALVVVGGGALVGQTGAPGLWLSVLATAIVAIAFGPVRAAVNRWLARALHRDRMSPYQVLAHFRQTATGAYPAAELPARMARVLAEGTGTAGAQVWLTVHGRLELAATWPAEPTHRTGRDPSLTTGGVGTVADVSVEAPAIGPDEPSDAPVVVVDGPRRSLPVRERGELLGALTVVVRDGQRLTPVEERLFAGLAAQSGLMLRVAGLRAGLEQQLIDLARRTEELRAARRDLVARQDAERKRLERNIHDGAQQQVIALLVNLRLARMLLDRSPERAARLLGQQAAAAREAIDTLTALSRGLYPRTLTEAGPVAALAAAVSSGPIPVDLTSSRLPRCPPDVEAAVYFSCLEAVQNAGKHSGAARIAIDIRGRFGADGSGEIGFTVSDDGKGFDATRRTGNGLLNISDRIESVRGGVSITSAPGTGTTIRGRIPTIANPDEPASGPLGTVDDRPPDTPRVAVAPVGGS